MTKIIHKELSYAVRGVLLDVYNRLGPMLPEQFYQDAVSLGLVERGIRCDTEKQFEVYYRGERVGLYFVDVWIEDGKIILELKVAPKIMPIHRAQAISYLKVTNADLAIVVSYGAGSLLDERLPNFLRDKVVPFDWEQKPTINNWLYPELSNQILEVLHGVHFRLGPGFLHQVYRRATIVELRYQGLAHDYIKYMPIYYHKHYLGEHEARLIRVENRLLLATVAVKQADRNMQEQLKARMRYLGLKFGLLANFNSTTLRVMAVRV